MDPFEHDPKTHYEAHLVGKPNENGWMTACGRNSPSLTSKAEEVDCLNCLKVMSKCQSS